MKALATIMMLLLSLPVPHTAPPVRAPMERRMTAPARKGGRWYLAQNGHAVYCYGPVRVVPQARGGLQRVATYCQGDKIIVPLKD